MASNDSNPTSQDKPEAVAPVVDIPPLTANLDDDADESIPHPTMELYRHTLLRGANLGSVVALIVGPPVLFFRGVRKPAEMLRRMASICAKGMGIGIALGAIMTMMRCHGNTDEQMYDRAYRLRYNKGQIRTDKFSYGGAVLGGLVGAAMLPVGPVSGAIQGASMGLGLAVAAHVLTKPKEEKKKE